MRPAPADTDGAFIGYVHIKDLLVDDPAAPPEVRRLLGTEGGFGAALVTAALVAVGATLYAVESLDEPRRLTAHFPDGELTGPSVVVPIHDGTLSEVGRGMYLKHIGDFGLDGGVPVRDLRGEPATSFDA